MNVNLTGDPEEKESGLGGQSLKKVVPEGELKPRPTDGERQGLAGVWGGGFL